MYVQLDGDYYDHPKTMHLIALVGPEADCYPPRLWTWALKYAKGGILKTPDMLEVACRWKGAKGLLHKAMVEAGFIDADGVTLHGWMDRTGHDILRYEEKKGRLREKYRNSSGRLPAVYLESSAVSERNGTELNGTELNGEEWPPTPATPKGLLWRLFKKAHLVGTPHQQRQFFEAWYAQAGPQRLEQILMEPRVVGKDVFAVQKWYFNDMLKEAK